MLFIHRPLLRPQSLSFLCPVLRVRQTVKNLKLVGNSQHQALFSSYVHYVIYEPHKQNLFSFTFDDYLLSSFLYSVTYNVRMVRFLYVCLRVNTLSVKKKNIFLIIVRFHKGKVKRWLCF